MTGAKHTPGPKECLKETLDALHDALTELRLAAPKRAGAYGESYGPVLALGAETLAVMPSDNLIAAAPEMLDALIEILPLASEEAESRSSDAWEKAQAAVQRARNVVTKAEGKQ